MSQPDTKQRILDAAERLFAKEGFHCSSLRGITREAEANIAAVHYHFGSKEALIEAVFERRLQQLNPLRIRQMENVREVARQGGRRPKVEEILRAFVEPTFRFRDSEPGTRHFVTLVGRVLAEPDDRIRGIFVRRMMPIFLFTLELLEEALPELPRPTLFWRLHFTIGAVSHILQMDAKFQNFVQFPEGIQVPNNLDSLLAFLLTFLTAGLEAQNA